MRQLSSWSVSFAFVAIAVATVSACSSGSGGPAPTADAGPPDAGPLPPVDAGLDAARSIVVTPATANVLTCDTLQLKETGGAGNGTWSVTGAGTIGPTGLYAAPTTAPASPAVSISYAEPPASASAQIQVATAFPGAPVKLPIGSNPNVRTSPFHHPFAANGAQIYGTQIDSGIINALVYTSSDNGATFAAQSTYHTGHVLCAASAVDAGNPGVVYLVYYAGHDDTTNNTGATVRLAVSTDGGKTFAKQYVIVDSLNSVADMICPDVVSPSADHVLVSGTVGKSGPLYHVGTFASASQGANIGPASTGTACAACPADGSVFFAASDTNAATAQSIGIVDDNGTNMPTLGTNGNGAVCTVYQYNGGNNPNTTKVQCSTDSGVTWTSPVDLGSPKANAAIVPTVAVSPSGKVAVAWTDTVTVSGAAQIQTFLALSADGGKTFAAPIQVPAVKDKSGATLDVVFPVPAWESDDILWVGESANGGNASSIHVNKTCDGGKTWSGDVLVADDYRSSSVVKTTAGMMIGGYQNPPAVVLLPLFSR